MFKRSLLVLAFLVSCVVASAQKVYTAFMGTYSPVAIYAKNEIVLSGSTYYISLLPLNVNHLPSASPLQWAVFSNQAAVVGPAGESAYQIAVDNGFTGTIQQWLASLTGTPGIVGSNGSTWFQGTTSPAAGTGVNGDFYLNTATSDVSRKTAGAWSVIVNLKGTTGAAGLGFTFRGVWTANTAYAPYDVVTYGGATYEASTSFTSGSTFNASSWNVWASTASVTACTSNGMNSTYYAACYAGSDVGAQINAADLAMGSKGGQIIVADGVVSSTTNGVTTSTISTPVNISANHKLIIGVPLKVTAVGWTIDNNTTVVSAGQNAPLTITSQGALITATSKSNLETSNVWATWTSVASGDTNELFSGRNVSYVTVHDSHLIGGGYIRTTSTTDDYSTTIVGSNDSSYIYAYRNYVDGVTGPCNVTAQYPNCASGAGVYPAFYKFTQHVWDDTATCLNAGLCRFVWGGNNNSEWTSFDPATLKASDIHFSNLTFNNVEAAEVWSLASKFFSTGAQGTGCGDVCLDPEGSQGGNIAMFDVGGALNGELATFFHVKDVTFFHGKVRHTAALSAVGGQSLSAFTNNPTNASDQSLNIALDEVTFDCTLPNATMCTIQLDPASRTVIRNSTLNNTQIRNSDGALESGDLAYLGNKFNITGNPVVAVTGTLVSGNTTVTLASVFGVRPGSELHGAGLNPSTFVQSVNVSNNTVVISAAPSASATETVTFDVPVVDLTTVGPGQQILDGNVMTAAAGSYDGLSKWIYGAYSFNNGHASPALIVRNNTTSGMPHDLQLNIQGMTGGTAIFHTYGNSWGAYSTRLFLDLNGFAADFWTEDYVPTAPSGSCPATATGRWVTSDDGHTSFCNGTSWAQKI